MKNVDERKAQATDASYDNPQLRTKQKKKKSVFLALGRRTRSADRFYSIFHIIIYFVNLTKRIGAMEASQNVTRVKRMKYVIERWYTSVGVD